MGLRARAGRLPENPVGRVADGVFLLKVLGESGLLRPTRPDRAAQMGLTYLRWRNNPATASALAAIRHPDRIAVLDEAGSVTFAEADRRANALANSLRARGITAGDGIAIMARNHRGFVDATLAASKLGASALYLNTMFAAPQIADVVEREGPRALIADDEFAGSLELVESEIDRFASWRDGRGGAEQSTDELIAQGSEEPPPPPAREPRFVILTSGTTGTPKGAQRQPPSGLTPLAALIDAIPYRAWERMAIAAPMFHSWGFLHLVIALTLGNAITLRRRFDPEDTLRACQAAGARTLALVPVMMQRILELPSATLDLYPLPELRITAVSGSALPGELALEWMDRFGDCVYNLYGSTEVAYATIAGPADLRAAPGTAGRPPRGTVVRIVDEHGRDRAPGEVGRIFVGNQMAFEGYTGGGGKEALGELFSTGDVGHFDAEGRLFVDGRDDEMIVSGGENVFPREVEDLLADHEAVKEVAVIGVDDEEFGQRLKAFVVLHDRETPGEDELKAHVKANLAAYKVPREIAFLNALPRNATGKVLKRELA